MQANAAAHVITCEWSNFVAMTASRGYIFMAIPKQERNYKIGVVRECCTADYCDSRLVRQYYVTDHYGQLERE